MTDWNGKTKYCSQPVENLPSAIFSLITVNWIRQLSTSCTKNTDQILNFSDTEMLVSLSPWRGIVNCYLLLFFFLKNLCLFFLKNIVVHSFNRCILLQMCSSNLQLKIHFFFLIDIIRQHYVFCTRFLYFKTQP